MNVTQQEAWQRRILKEVLSAIMQDADLRNALVFKGAWILNFQLGEDRHSRDLDATTAPEWTSHAGDLTAQEAFFKTHLPSALTRHFERQNPVRFTVGPLIIKRVPHRQHPRGWDMLRIRIPITDHEHSSPRGLPPVELEIAAPEKLGPDSTEIRDFLGTPACVYTLHRIAGEKLRAYLTSLPAYRDKMGAPRDMRVKDLYDLTRILQHQPITQTEFWKKALAEFLLACESRYVDCEGPTTFRQEWALAKQLYEQDLHLHLQKIPFNEVETALNTLLNFLEQQGIFPLQFPLPPETETSQSPPIK